MSEDGIQPISEDNADTVEDTNQGESDKQSNENETKPQFTFEDFPKELRIRIFQLLAVTDLMKAAMVMQNALMYIYCQ